jgi:hypothetical protein
MMSFPPTSLPADDDGCEQVGLPDVSDDESIPGLDPGAFSSDEATLPDDDSGDEWDDNIELPHCTWTSSHRCCKRCCMRRTDLIGQASANKAAIHARSHTEGDALLMNIMGSTCDVSGKGPVTWKVNDTIVCRAAWNLMHGLSNARLSKVLQALRTTGAPPEDRRQYNTASSARSEPSNTCHAFFMWAYENLAEPLAETENLREAAFQDDSNDLFTEHEARESDLDSDLFLVHCDIESRELRWLSPQTIPDLYDMMECWMQNGVSSSKPPSMKTFRRVYNVWKSKLKIRAVGTHSRCTQCAETSRRLESCKDPNERAEIRASHMRQLEAFESRKITSGNVGEQWRLIVIFC